MARGTWSLGSPGTIRPRHKVAADTGLHAGLGSPSSSFPIVSSSSSICLSVFLSLSHTQMEVLPEKPRLPREPSSRKEAGPSLLAGRSSVEPRGPPAWYLHSDRITEAEGLKIKPPPPETPICSAPAAWGLARAPCHPVTNT